MSTFAILLSGRGTNMRAIASAVRSGRLGAQLSFVASDRADALGLRTAERMGFKTAILPYGEGREAGEKTIAALCAERNVQWIVLAGFMRLLSPAFVGGAYRNRIVNIHPSLLPSFPGTDGIGDAWRRGVKVTGVTVHLVDEGVDTGPILAQKAVPVKPDDEREDLERRIHRAEHFLYWRTLSELFSGRDMTARRR